MQKLILIALCCVAAVKGLNLINNQQPLDVGVDLNGVVGGNKQLRSSSYTSIKKEHHVKIVTNADGSVNHQYDSNINENSSVNGDNNDDDVRNAQSLKIGDSLQYNFKRDFVQRIDPIKHNSEWRWAMISSDNEHVANLGTFLRDAKSDSIDLISIPYKGWVAQDDTRVPPIADSYQAVLINKQNITVLNGQKLSVNVKFACTTFNNDQGPHKQSVSNAEDDPTLAACGFGICSQDQSALVFSIIATNQGVWAAYGRNPYELFAHPERQQRKFDVYKRIGDRQSSYETVDATIAYDRSQGKVYYMINNEVVYTIGQLGTLNNIIRDNSAYEQVYTQDRPDLVVSQPERFVVFVGLTQFPDTVDPNHPTKVHSVKLTTDSQYYDPKARFEDEQNLERDVQWGQGASMTLINADIKLRESVLRSGRQQDSDDSSADQTAVAASDDNKDNNEDTNNQPQ